MAPRGRTASTGFSGTRLASLAFQCDVELTLIGRYRMARQQGLRKALAEKFDDELKFFKGWIDKPKAVGSIVPTSSIAAMRMASVVNPDSGLPVLEVGPGTGVVTRAILARGVKPENLYLIEYSQDFVRHLRAQFKGVNVLHGNAFELDATLVDT